MSVEYSAKFFELGVYWYVVFLFSLVIHEAAHALVAMKLGDKTAYKGGQVSLNPLPHIKQEKVGTTAVPIFAYLTSGWMLGWASAPYDPEWAQKYPRRSAIMALAGPVSNLLLVVISIVIIKAGFQFGIFDYPEIIDYSTVTYSTDNVYELITIFLSILFSLNLVLFIFNLLPFPGFDGGHALLLFAPKARVDSIQTFMNRPKLIIFSLGAGWLLFDFIFEPIHLFFVNLLYPGIVYG